MSEQITTAGSLSAEEIRSIVDDNLLGRDNRDKPLWFEQVWRDTVGDSGHARLPKLESLPVRATYGAFIRSIPTAAQIKAVVDFSPAAAPLMAEWKAIWDRSFPGWETSEEWSKVECEKDGERYAIDWAHNIIGHIQKHQSPDKTASDYLSLEKAIARADQDVRDYRLHVIDDANACISLKHLKPYMGVVSLDGTSLVYVGCDDDGIPILLKAPKSVRMRHRWDDDNSYFTWDFFQPFMNRRSRVVRNRAQLATMLADMAQQGHKKAFVKGVKSKTGTYTVDISWVSSIDEAVFAALTAIDDIDRHFIVQEHLPYSHEQRYFVVDGRVVASVGSDRHFSAVDTRPGRRLDDRVATLNVPEIYNGEYDRGETGHVVDRKISAAFARQARKIARVLKENRVLDYTIDMGMTSRGVTAIEINGLFRSGPYCLDRALIARAFERRRLRDQIEMRKELIYQASTFRPETVTKLKEMLEKEPDIILPIANQVYDDHGINPFYPAMSGLLDRLLIKLSIASMRQKESTC